MKKETQYIYYSESAIQSLISDVGTFLTILASFYITIKYLGGNGFAMFILFCMAIFSVSARAHSKKITFTNKEELLNHINKTITNEDNLK